MKRVPAIAALLSLVFVLSLAVSVQGQAEKIKQKAKDLKKNVENGQSPTNKPPQKTPPPPPPQKPKS